MRRKQFSTSGRSGLIRAQGGAIQALPASGNRAQAAFQEKSQRYAASGVVTTQGFLRLESNLSGTVQGVTWNVTDNQGQQNVTERRLKISDTFTVLNWGFYIGIAASTSAADLSKMSLNTFPNPTQITGAGEAANYQAFYNGFLTLTVDSTKFFDSIPLYSFYRVGAAQQGTGGGGAGFVLTSRNEFPNSMFGTNAVYPSIELNGSSNNQLQAILPAAVSTAITGAVGVAVFFMQGLLHQGAATLQKSIRNPRG